jgi:hypothetical protein
MLISAVKIANFKRIDQVELTLADVTVLIGGNNSGKSSVLQGIHLAITTLQSQSARRFSMEQQIFKLTGNPERLRHLPIGSDPPVPLPTPLAPSVPLRLAPSVPLPAPRAPSTVTFTYAVDAAADPKSCTIALGPVPGVYTPDYSVFYKRASDRARPLSIFVPGLAGVALREERRTDAIVTAGIAEGDANLYLRNVLLRLIADPTKLDKFHSVIGGGVFGPQDPFIFR